MAQTAEARRPQPAEPNWPQPLKPGREMEALKRFHVDVTWTGHVKAAGGVPEMSATGYGRFRPIIGGLWIAGDFQQDQFYGGRKVSSWFAHYIVGWHVERKAYIAYAADSNGRSVPFVGVIDGDRFVITSEGMKWGDKPVELRMTWDVANPKAQRWINEMSIDRSPWMLIEEYVCAPT